MKRLPNKKLSTATLDLLIEDNLFDYGGEAIICRPTNAKSLYKIFVFPGTDIPDQMSDNKFKKILYYYQHDIANMVKPLSTLEYNGILIGYEESYDPDDLSLLDSLLTKEELITCLSRTKEQLDYFASLDITYGDVTADNILINQKTMQPKFCDIDNTNVAGYPIDVMGFGLTDYYDTVQEIDSKADIFMHNLLVLERLYHRNSSYQQVLNEIKRGNIPTDLDEIAQQIITSMANPQEFIAEPIIPFVKKISK